LPDTRTRLLSGAAALLAVCLAAFAVAAADRASLRTVEGTLTIVWGDPRPGASGGETRYALALTDGTVIPLQLNGHEQAALANFGKQVTITGLTSDAGTIDVDSIAGSGAETQSVIGTKKLIYLLVKFSDDAAVPHPPVFYTDLNNPDTPPVGEVFPTTVNAFFKKTSWNQFSWVGDVGGVGGVGASGGWLTLPHGKSYYAPCGWETACSLLTTLAVDATALGRAQGIDFTVYDNINFVLSNDLDCCAWGGGFYSAVDNKVYGATWEPPWGQETGTYSHELGHSIGLPHSGWIYYAYDSPWDIMSSRSAATNVLCGSYASANDAAPRNVFCSEPGDGYIAAHKDFLGWIPPANEVVSDTSSSTTMTLEGGSLPLGAGKKMLKICITGLPCDGSSAHYFTVEARVKALGATSQYDNAIPGDGVIIHEIRRDASPVFGSCFFNSQSGFAFPVDSTPADYDSGACNFGGRVYPNFALYNAQWSPGQTYTNVISIAVVSRSGSNFVVSTTGKAPPTASSVNPNIGSLAGGTNFTITGTDFVAGSVVTFDGSGASNVNVVNPTTITATSPSHSAGAVDVVIRNPIGQTAIIVSGFTYTSAVPFTDTSLVSNSTAIKKVHITELRTRIDALRQQYGGFGFFSYTTDPTITPGMTTIKTQHIIEMRAALAPAYSVATGTTATYATDPTLVAGTKVKAAHIAELRALVLAIE
jgi:M6 family metalloprotease-like protein